MEWRIAQVVLLGINVILTSMCIILRLLSRHPKTTLAGLPAMFYATAFLSSTLLQLDVMQYKLTGVDGISQVLAVIIQAFGLVAAISYLVKYAREHRFDKLGG